MHVVSIDDDDDSFVKDLKADKCDEVEETIRRKASFELFIIDGYVDENLNCFGLMQSIKNSSNKLISCAIFLKFITFLSVEKADKENNRIKM